MDKKDFKKVVDIALRKKLYIISIIVIFLVLGIIYSFFVLKNEYVSKTTFLLGVPTAVTEEGKIDEGKTSVVRTSLRIDAQTVATYNEIVKSNSSIGKIKNNLNLDIKDYVLKNAISVSRAQKSDVVEITVVYTDPKIASNIANESVKVFSERIKEIYKISEIYVIDKAIPAENAQNVNHTIDIVLFGIIGILVSIVYCILVCIFDKTIKSIESIEELGLKVLATIPNGKNKKQDLEKLIDFKKEKKQILKSFDELKMNVQFTNINNKTNKVILVTSSFSSEGKSYVAANLAAVFAKAGKKVIVIDMDMRAGMQAGIFETPNNLGISNYLSNIDTNGVEIKERINSYIKETSIKNLNLITSGTVPPNSSDLLITEKLPELIKDLSVFYDFIIFDGAPVLPVPDSLILSNLAGSTILVSLAGKTQKEDLKKSKRDLQNIGGRVIGVVLNEASSKDKKVRKAYLKLEAQNVEKENKKLHIKEKAVKIKKWIFEHIILFKKKGEQLLLGDFEEKENTSNSQNEIDNKLDNKLDNTEIENKTNNIKKEKEVTIQEPQVEKTDVQSKEKSNFKSKYNKLKTKTNDMFKTTGKGVKVFLERTGDFFVRLRNNVKTSTIKSVESTKKYIFKINQKNKENINKVKENIKNSFSKARKYIDEKKLETKFKRELRKKQKEESKVQKIKQNDKEEFEYEYDYEKTEKEELAKDLGKKFEDYANEIVEDFSEKVEEIVEEIVEQKEEIRPTKEQLKLEKAIKREQEKLDKMDREEEKKAKKEMLKQEKRQKKANIKKERRKNRRMKMNMRQEEKRLKEELSEDNLYPKTKNNKNL